MFSGKNAFPCTFVLKRIFFFQILYFIIIFFGFHEQGKVVRAAVAQIIHSSSSIQSWNFDSELDEVMVSATAAPHHPSKV